MENEPLDPDRRYPACGLRTVDKVAIHVHRLLSNCVVERTRDVYQFTVDDPGGLVVLVTPDVVEFRLPTVEWTWGYAGPVCSSRPFKRLRIASTSQPAEGKLGRLIEQTRRARLSETRPCAYCQRPTPPEHAHAIDSDWVCHGCAERYRGIVH